MLESLFLSDGEEKSMQCSLCQYELKHRRLLRLELLLTAASEENGCSDPKFEHIWTFWLEDCPAVWGYINCFIIWMFGQVYRVNFMNQFGSGKFTAANNVIQSQRETYAHCGHFVADYADKNITS